VGALLSAAFGCGSDGLLDTVPVEGASGTAGASGGGASGATAGAAGAPATGGAGGRAPSAGAWGWAGIIGTGQSLAVGTLPVNAAVNQQPYENLMLSLGGAAVPPFDPALPALSVVPLVEPLRPQGGGFPRAYPGNLFGETPHGAMAAQISALAAAAGQTYVSVHTVVGESGQGMVALRKGAVETSSGGGVVGRAYAASIFEASAIQRLAGASGVRYGVGAIVMTHGETDAGAGNYEAQLVQLWSDYNQDLRAITGQAEAIPMIVSQHHAYGFTAGSTSGASASTLAQWQASVNHPGDILCSGPKYHYPYIADGIHLEVRGYEMLGEKYGEVYFQAVVQKAGWRPLEPTAVTRNGRVVRVQFHVPVPPLDWDEAIVAPHRTALTAWAEGRGFELRSGNTPIAIESVALDGDTVAITSGADIPAGAIVGYAVTSDGASVLGLGHRWGQLRDSDPFVGAVTGAAQPNYAVAFERPIPAE
jgi:hypothetical protein